MIVFTINQLISSDFYLGFYSKNWNNLINIFLLGRYRGVNIFNLNYSLVLLKNSFSLISYLIKKSGNIWVVNDRNNILNKIPQIKILTNKYNNFSLLNNKWKKGSLTNYNYKALQYNKSSHVKFPSAVFCLSITNNFYAINECFILKIPSISIADTIENPLNVFYPIPGNTKSLNSSFFIINALFKVVGRANALRKIGFLNKIKFIFAKSKFHYNILSWFPNYLFKKEVNKCKTFITYIYPFIFSNISLSIYLFFIAIFKFANIKGSKNLLNQKGKDLFNQFFYLNQKNNLRQLFLFFDKFLFKLLKI